MAPKTAGTSGDALWGLTLSAVSDALRNAGLRPLVGAGAKAGFSRPFRGATPLASALLRVGFAAYAPAARAARAARASLRWGGRLR